MNIKRNKSGIGKRLAATLFALVVIAGITAFAPSPAKGRDSISLKSIKTDASKVIESNSKLCRGSWFVEMVQPVDHNG